MYFGIGQETAGSKEHYIPQAKSGVLIFNNIWFYDTQLKTALSKQCKMGFTLKFFLLSNYSYSSGFCLLVKVTTSIISFSVVLAQF